MARVQGAPPFACVSKQKSSPAKEPESFPPPRCGVYLKNQNFRELSLMPGPIVEEITADLM